MMILIYQIARFDRDFEKELRFDINGAFCSETLSSFALRAYLGKAKTILLFPVSLYFNSGVINSLKNEDLKYKLKKVLNTTSQEYLDFINDPYPLYREHPQAQKADDILVIQSVGTYEGVVFQSSLNILILQIFTDLVKRYLEEPFSTLYLDISSGHNIYISAVIEAGRLFSTFTNLQHLGSKEKAPKIFITFSEPIRPNYDGPYKVFTDYAFETKAFYHYPLLPTTSNLKDAYTIHAKDVSTEIADGNRAFKNKLNEILSHGYFFYSALKNNTPLVLYFWEHHPAESIETFLKEINNLVIKKLSTNYLNVHINNIDLIKKVYLCLSLYLGIVRILRERTIKPKAEVNLRELIENFSNERSSLYRYLELMHNRAYISHELSNNFKEENQSKFHSEFRPLREFVGSESRNEVPNKRNFQAHCGLERNCVEVRKVNGDIYLRYVSSQEIRGLIESFVMSA